MAGPGEIDAFIAQWRDTGGSELANTQSFINGLCTLIGVAPPQGSRTDDAHNDYVFERRVFQDNGDGTTSFGRIDAYKRDCFILEAKQGSEADRAAEARGDADLDLFGQTASTRVKRGTARRGTPGWAKAMVQAKGQAERYAKALPSEHGWPPFLLVTDIGYCIEVYADFTGTGKAYAQFPDRSRYRIMLEDLRDDEVRNRLAAIWTAPKTLDPAIQSAKVTREIADLLARVSKRLEARGYNAESVSGFLMRVLFTMFAEDTEVLLPKDSFKTLLREHVGNPQHLHHSLSALWRAMDKGEFAPALRTHVKHFNGYLFKQADALELDGEELAVLIEAAEKDWRDVEPAIFGTLLERALNPKERAKLGAHYTPRAYVERLISPTIMEPLRSDWDGVRGAAATLIGEDKAGEARALVEAFHGKLAQTRVLDPACGTGNFLYVAMARMKELEGEVLDLLVELGDDQYVAQITGHTITPENFLGIEINPRAAAIAQLVLWIGYLQWHFRVNGASQSPPEPILRDIRTIENRDALIAYDRRELERDEHERPVTRWDGETMKDHPVTGRKVPDETALVEVYRYVKPRAAKWPKADFIVGNPPFIGNKRLKDELGGGYVQAIREVYNSLPASTDFVLYWWHRASQVIKTGTVQRFGFITTSTINQALNRQVIEAGLRTSGASISFAIPDHPWVDESGSAAVRISMTTVQKGETFGQLGKVVDETAAPDGIQISFRTGKIGPLLTIGADLTQAHALKANLGIARQGMIFIGDGFIVTEEVAKSLGNGSIPSVVKPFRNGRDITSTARGLYVIDLYGLNEIEVSRGFPHVYQHLITHVKAVRDQNNEAYRQKNWFLFARPNTDLRSAISGLKRYIATVRTSRHRTFQFVDGGILPESRLVAIGSDDGLMLGQLSSRFHCHWSTAWGARRGVGNDPNYNNVECFDPFPFPADVPEPLKDHIRTEAEALDALRKRVLAANTDLTLTKLYNVLEALRADRALTEVERDIHDRGLVTLIRQHHDAIDAAVAEAYGWGADWVAGTLTDEEILVRLVALNKERAAEEAKGLIRWLRPEYQAPAYAAPVDGTLDLGEAAAVLPDNVIPWPLTLPEQVSAVQSVLASAPAPMAPHDIARAFKGKRAATVRPVLDALAGIGMARRLEDGRYAA
ncbi:MAG: SAM-dependent methyltransferase [Sphingomonas sp. 28-66-16]|nr:MAG: SAM-dependent methyltransferase [Sphingomonas sp. 28-66-16]